MLLFVRGVWVPIPLRFVGTLVCPGLQCLSLWLRGADRRKKKKLEQGQKVKEEQKKDEPKKE